MKNIVVDVSDGIVVGVHVPDGEYNVHVIDVDDYPVGGQDPLVAQYYQDVEEVKKDLVEVLNGPSL